MEQRTSAAYRGNQAGTYRYFLKKLQPLEDPFGGGKILERKSVRKELLQIDHNPPLPLLVPLSRVGSR